MSTNHLLSSDFTSSGCLARSAIPAELAELVLPCTKEELKNLVERQFGSDCIKLVFCVGNLFIADYIWYSILSIETFFITTLPHSECDLRKKNGSTAQSEFSENMKSINFKNNSGEQ